LGFAEHDILRARKRLVEMHFRAGCGHIGGNLSSLDAMMLVHHEFLGATDRFILSKGHSAGALYVTLWSLGLLSDADLDTFHADGTLLPAHPPPSNLPGIEFATGSLGHGLSLAAGLALSRRLKSSEGRIFGLTSDGEWQEGSTWEALIFAAHQKLGNLTILIDRNGLQGFGSTDDVASMQDIPSRLSGFGIDVTVTNGHDLDAMRTALKVETSVPHVIVLDTIKGHGVPSMEGRMESHYLPLTQEQFQDFQRSVGAE